VINFDVPALADDYIHRVGRTARAELKGDAITFVAPDEESTLRTIERAVGQRIARLTLPGFNYSEAAPQLEIPIAERIARARAERARGRSGRGGATTATLRRRR
jgi:ATP-dependent RNA helicase RhlE